MGIFDAKIFFLENNFFDFLQTITENIHIFQNGWYLLKRYERIEVFDIQCVEIN